MSGLLKRRNDRVNDQPEPNPLVEKRTNRDRSMRHEPAETASSNPAAAFAAKCLLLARPQIRRHRGQEAIQKRCQRHAEYPQHAPKNDADDGERVR